MPTKMVNGVEHPFRAWLERNRRRHFQTAKVLGCSATTLSRYFSGSRTPRPRRMAAMAEFTGGEVTTEAIVGWHATHHRPRSEHAGDQQQAAA